MAMEAAGGVVQACGEGSGGSRGAGTKEGAVSASGGGAPPGPAEDHAAGGAREAQAGAPGAAHTSVAPHMSDTRTCNKGALFICIAVNLTLHAKSHLPVKLV